ncbi:MAG: glycosyltransferase [Candidatus Binatia bacterium]
MNGVVQGEPLRRGADSRGPREVVYLIASMDTGGTQTHLLQLFRFLDRGRYRPHLFCLRDSGDLLSKVRELGVEVTTFGSSGSLSNPNDLRGMLEIIRRLRVLRPAVVHGYLLRGNFFASVCGWLSRVPVIVSSKRGLHRPVGRSEILAVKVSNRLSRAITGNSPAVLDFSREVEAAPNAKLRMIPSGIDVGYFQPGASRRRGVAETPVLGTVLQFKAKKGYPMLFEALAAARERLPGLTVRVAGAASLDGEPLRLAESLGVAGAIEPLGIIGDMRAFLAALDLFVLPSQSEGMSNALLEAMAMELPVVATAVGGAPMVIEEGVSGHLVEYGEHERMAARLVTLAGDTARRSRMGEAARKRVVERFSAQTMVSQIEALYDELLAVSD